MSYAQRYRARIQLGQLPAGACLQLPADCGPAEYYNASTTCCVPTGDPVPGGGAGGGAVGAECPWWNPFCAPGVIPPELPPGITPQAACPPGWVCQTSEQVAAAEKSATTSRYYWAGGAAVGGLALGALLGWAVAR